MGSFWARTSLIHPALKEGLKFLCKTKYVLYSDCLPGAESFPDAEDSNKACLSHGYREGKLVNKGGLHVFTHEA